MFDEPYPPLIWSRFDRKTHPQRLYEVRMMRNQRPPLTTTIGWTPTYQMTSETHAGSRNPAGTLRQGDQDVHRQGRILNSKLDIQLDEIRSIVLPG